MMTVTVLSARLSPHELQHQHGRQVPATFVCPGHKSAFDAKGNVLAGPSPRPMDTLEHKVENGMLMVRYQKFKKNIPAKEVFT